MIRLLHIPLLFAACAPLPRPVAAPPQPMPVTPATQPATQPTAADQRAVEQKLWEYLREKKAFEDREWQEWCHPTEPDGIL